MDKKDIVNTKYKSICDSEYYECDDFVIFEAKYKTLITDKFKNRKKWEKKNPKKIFSQIPGTIIELNVKVGDTVESGELMLVLEAMKMRNRIYYPLSGKIKSVNVEQGQKIAKNHLMVEFE